MQHLIRRRRTQAAIAELMETFTEALREASQDNPNGVPATDVASKAFLPQDGPYIQFTQYILNQLAQAGFAENAAGGAGPGQWRPTTPT